MKVRLASPLFIVRNEAEKDLFSVLGKLRGIGFEGIEFLGFFGKTPAEIRIKLDELSLKAVGNHVGADVFMKEPDKVIADHLELGCEYITISLPSGAIKPGSTQFDEIIEDIKSLSRKCVNSGITPLYHNHAFEFDASQSAYMLDAIMDACLHDGLRLEPDLGWMATKHVNPESYLQKYKDYCPVIHLKDIYSDGSDDFEFRPTGYGTVNYPQLMPSCLECAPDWFVIDHDLAYERDSFADLKMSFDYIKNLLSTIRALAATGT